MLYLLVFLGSTLVASGVHEDGASRPTRLRFQCTVLDKAAREASAHSKTFRALASAIEQSDVIVYVSSGSCARGAAACTRLVAVAGPLRYLRVTLDRFRLTRWEIPCVLAHELRHAYEITAEPTVLDEESLRNFLRRVGRGHGDDFETEAAIVVQRQVRAELNAGRSGQRPRSVDK